MSANASRAVDSTDEGAVLSVSELNRRARQSLERDFPLLWVAGEISNLARPASGHIYFSLKDESAQVRCVMFRSRAQVLPWRLENGQQVEARALVSLYEPRGDFQLTVESLRQAGLGRLYQAFAQLKAMLEAEGLFAAERKRPIPRLPRAIGIVSSPQAAALRDVLAAIRRRAPHLPAIIYPTPVQGAEAIAGITEAIAAAVKRNECDVLLIVRGGGSIEDLWSFNEEAVARAIASCPLPTVCGVGHETDHTIADLVADLRAATPTAAAELATQGWVEAVAVMQRQGLALNRAFDFRLGTASQAIDRLALRLVHPAARLKHASATLQAHDARMRLLVSARLSAGRQALSTCAVAIQRLAPRMDRYLTALDLLRQSLRFGYQSAQSRRQASIQRLETALDHLNPAATMARGFAIVRSPEGRIVSDAGQVSAGDLLTLQFAHGEADTQVVSTRR